MPLADVHRRAGTVDNRALTFRSDNFVLLRNPHHNAAPWRRALYFTASLLFLNGLLSFRSWWPTIAVLPDARIAPEFVGLWLILSGLLAVRGAVPRWLLNGLAAFYALLVLGRYVDVIAPSLFGRPISLYWDVPQIPRFVWVTAAGLPWWADALAVLALAAMVWGFHRLLRGAMQGLVDGTQALLLRPGRRWVTAAVTAALTLLVAANYAGVQATWPYVSKPVMPTYWREMKLVFDAASPDSVARALPAATVVDDSLARPADRVLASLGGRDVHLVFLESFGAVLYDQPDVVAAVDAVREDWLRAVQASGRDMVSAFYRSPTIGGASDLAHMSVLSGIDLSDPRRHDLLLTTRRPTLLQVFQHAGYDVFGVYHSVWWDWVERSYYRFDTYLSGPDLDYRGPAIGYWRIPDQFAAARVEQLYPRTNGVKPRLTLLATMSTHFPFTPVPPYQPDWTRVLGEQPFDAADVARVQTEQVNWLDMRPDYLRSVRYAYTWLAGYFGLPEPRDTVYVLIGDHQPTTNVAGEGARWDVPVHVIARDPALLDRFRALGFRKGLHPAPAPLGGLHDLTGALLRALGDDGQHATRLR